VKKLIACAALALVVAACSPFSRRPGKALPPPSSNSVEGLAAAIQDTAQRSEHQSDSKTRVALAMQASVDADACVKLDPRAVACLYGSAIAMSLQARAYPTEGGLQLLNEILQTLTRAEAADPNYDHAGPARVQALVYLRAPGWPLGPGDADSGLDAARRAVSLQPDYPPNRLALAEAQLKTGDTKGARESYTRARELAQALPSGPDREDWVHQATEALLGR
jgi:tetratricopeptide (TPR) repeat protein